jgi:cytidylate kinase
MIITIAGVPGAGKSTVKNHLAEKLNMKAYSIGDMRGKMARDRGLTIDEFNALGMEQDFTDREVDAFQKKLGETEDNFIIDGWLGWNFIPHSLKIFLDCEPAEAAKRIYADRKGNPHRADEADYASVEETAKTISERLAQTRARYQKWYGVDFLDKKHYDIVIDTSKNTPDQTFEQVLAAIKAHQATDR